MKSIRQRLLISLLVSITFVSLFTDWWSCTTLKQALLPLVLMYPVLILAVWFSVENALQGIRTLSVEVGARKANEQLTPINVNSVPAELKPLVDELNHLFTRLTDTFEREQRFTADAAHELRTPLAALKTQAQVALRAQDAEAQTTAVYKIMQCVDRSSRIVTQLSILNHLKPDEPLREIEAVDLVFLAREIISDLFNDALRRSSEVELHYSNEPIIIMGDKILLGVLIRNLVDNAIRYSGRNAMVKIDLSAKEGSKLVTLTVEDSGPGIPCSMRERIFERFYRALGTKTTGSGLGLSIVSQIVRLHHGNIHASQSKSLGGACFVVQLTKASLPASVAKKDIKGQTAHKRQKRKKAPSADLQTPRQTTILE